MGRERRGDRGPKGLDEDRERKLRQAGAELQAAEKRRSEAISNLKDALLQADGDVSVADAAEIADVPTVAVYAFRPEDED